MKVAVTVTQVLSAPITDGEQKVADKLLVAVLMANTARVERSLKSVVIKRLIKRGVLRVVGEDWV